MKNKRFYFFIGTTAEFIKLAPVIRELKRRKIKFKIIASGQNQINFQELIRFTGEVLVDFNLPKKVIKSSVVGFFAWTVKTFFLTLMLLRRESKISLREEAYLIIHGDTISSLIGAIVGKVCGFRVVQVEAGLRSFNLLEPLPEEICRLIISLIADVFFAPNDWATSNLERFRGKKINTKQNTLIESSLWAVNQQISNNQIKNLKNYYVLFIHRQEHIYFNQDKTREMIYTTINNAPKNLSCVLVMHALTSRILTSEELEQLYYARKNLITLPKLPYTDFINLINRSEFIATDSCTAQEETSYLGIPYLSLRNLTERTEGLNKNVVISKGRSQVIKHFLSNYKQYKHKRISLKDQPSKIVVDCLISNSLHD